MAVDPPVAVRAARGRGRSCRAQYDCSVRFASTGGEGVTGEAADKATDVAGDVVEKAKDVVDRGKGPGLRRPAAPPSGARFAR